MKILITGASRGIGKAIAGAFARQGHELYLSSRNDLSLYKALEELQLHFPESRFKAKAFDVAEKEQARELGQWMLAEGGAPDVLVNNAGVFEPGSVYNEPDGALERQLATNLHSAYHLTRTVLPAMMSRRSGHIFNMCSIASLKAYDNGGAYSISKFALYGFSKNLREELKPHGIKVTAVLPGAVFTDSWGDYDNSRARIMEAADIAELVYTASQLSAGACVEDIVVRPQLGDL
ncbi:MAG: SDR family oxidoreductase [Chitinophagaceae bacterium]